MTATDHAMKLIIDGYVVVPQAFDADQVRAIRDAYERRCNQLGRRDLSWDDIRPDPDLIRWVAHPKTMAVVEAYTKHFGHEAVVASCPVMRDGAAPGAGPRTIDPQAVARGDIAGIHDDAQPAIPYSVMETGCAMLLFLDDTHAHSGAFIVAPHTRQFTRVDEDDNFVKTDWEMVRRYCNPTVVPVKTGSMIFLRPYTWHAGSSAAGHRRVYHYAFTTRAQYDQCAEHHGVFTQSDLANIPPEQHRFIITRDA